MTTDLQTPGQLLFAKLGINLDEVPIEQLSDYTAVEYYLTVEDEPPSDAANIEKVRRYLEAFHHLSELEAWARAREILSISLDTPINEELHGQLYIWGYYREQIELYSSLLGKLSSTLDIMFLRGLGVAYRLLAVYKQAIDYSQQSLALARKLGDQAGEGTALGNLGIAYDSLEEYDQAIEYYQQHLVIARSIGDRAGEGRTLCNWGITLFKIERYSEALKYSQTALKIVSEIGDSSVEANTFYLLAKLHQKLGHRDLADKYGNQALAIAIELGIPLAKECQELKEKLLSENT